MNRDRSSLTCFEKHSIRNCVASCPVYFLDEIVHYKPSLLSKPGLVCIAWLLEYLHLMSPISVGHHLELCITITENINCNQKCYILFLDVQVILNISFSVIKSIYLAQYFVNYPCSVNSTKCTPNIIIACENIGHCRSAMLKQLSLTKSFEFKFQSSMTISK